MKGKPTRVDIKIDCSFMKLAPLSVNWNFDVADQRDVLLFREEPPIFRRRESIRSSVLIFM
jgi:hypothetical protein